MNTQAEPTLLTPEQIAFIRNWVRARKRRMENRSNNESARDANRAAVNNVRKKFT